MFDKRLLLAALRAVREAELVIMRHYASADVQVRVKEDGTLVTVADVEAERVVRELICNTFPDHAFLGEECGLTDKGRRFTWVLDPIDGTKQFSRRLPLFATELALLADDVPVLGVSNAPAFGELMRACRGDGAFLNDVSIRVSEVSRLEEAAMSFGSLKYFAGQGRAAALFSLANKVRLCRGIGDAWSYHLLAQGKIDIMIEAATRLWDVAAMAVIIEEAGGRVTDLDGHPISPDTRSALATNGLLHDQVLEVLRV
jgi:histidinol-phosphatase